MVWIYLIASLVVIVGTFVGGAIYGRRAERRASTYLRSILDSVDRRVE